MKEIKLGTIVYYDKYKNIGKGEVTRITEDSSGRMYKLNDSNATHYEEDLYLNINEVKERMKKETTEKYYDELSDIEKMNP